MQRENRLFHDFNADGEEDGIEIEYVKMEGSEYISRFEVEMTGCKNSFVLEQYEVQEVRGHMPLTYQYIWGKDGHADGQGTLASVVSLDKKGGCFLAEESWLQRE